MTQFYAQPYDIEATGFYFEDASEYEELFKECRNFYGQPVEEFEIQWIDGETIDQELFEALGICQPTVQLFLEKLDEWSDEDKEKIIIYRELGYEFNLEKDSPDDIDIIYYKVESMKALAEEFVDEGLYGEIPEALQNHIDYDSIANDLSCSGEYGEIDINGEHIIYNCC